MRALSPAPAAIDKHLVLDSKFELLENIVVRFRPAWRRVLISAWQPRASGLWIEPGMANTSRPCSAASRAVISEPLWRAASTTSVPRLRPLMMRLRRGKLAAQRRCAGRKFADQAPRWPRCAQPARRCCARIDLIEPRAEHRDGPAAGCERALVAGGIDAQRQTAGDRQSGRDSWPANRAPCAARAAWGCGCRRWPVAASSERCGLAPHIQQRRAHRGACASSGG